VSVTELIDNNDNDTLESFQVIRSFNVKKHSISECLRSLLAPLICVIFSCIKKCKNFNFVNFFNRD